MDVRVKAITTLFPTNTLYTPMDDTPLYSIANVNRMCNIHGVPLVVLLYLELKAKIYSGKVGSFLMRPLRLKPMP